VRAFLEKLARESRSAGKELMHQSGLTQDEDYEGWYAIAILAAEAYYGVKKALSTSWLWNLLKNGPKATGWDPFANVTGAVESVAQAVTNIVAPPQTGGGGGGGGAG